MVLHPQVQSVASAILHVLCVPCASVLEDHAVAPSVQPDRGVQEQSCYVYRQVCVGLQREVHVLGLDHRAADAVPAVRESSVVLLPLLDRARGVHAVHQGQVRDF